MVMETRQKLLTIEQAAQRLGISARTLRNWADKGLIPVVKLPSGYRRFEPAVIDAKRRELGFRDGDGAEA